MILVENLHTRTNMINGSLSITVFAISFIFTSLAILAVVLRLLAKHISRTKISIEDYLCITGLFLIIGMFISLVLMIQLGGVGHDTADLDPSTLTFAFQILIGYQPLYCLSVAIVKSSICFFYIRIFAITKRYRIVAYWVVAFIAAWAIMSILIAFLSCTPFEYTWDQSIPDGYCIDQTGAFVAEAVLDLLADTMVFALPLRPIWNLQINTQKKFVLTGIFGLGISTMVMAILRIIGLAKLDLAHFQTSGVGPLICSILEPAIGILVACIPLLQPLIKNTWLGRRLARSGQRSRRTAHKTNSSITRSEDEHNGNEQTSPPRIAMYLEDGTSHNAWEHFREGNRSQAIIKTSHTSVNRAT